MSNKYCNTTGSTLISALSALLNAGFAGVETDTSSLQAQIDNLVVGAGNTTIGVFSIADATHTNAYTGTVADLTYFTGLKINLKVTNPNTSASTFNLNSLGVKNIKVMQPNGTKRDVFIGEVLGTVSLEYDGTDFLLITSHAYMTSGNVAFLGKLVDTAGAIVLDYLRTASAVNHLQLGNAVSCLGANKFAGATSNANLVDDFVEDGFGNGFSYDVGTDSVYNAWRRRSKKFWILPNTQYTFSLKHKGTYLALYLVKWYDADDVEISASSFSHTGENHADFTLASTVVTSPSNARYARIWFDQSGNGTSEYYKDYMFAIGTTTYANYTKTVSTTTGPRLIAVGNDEDIPVSIEPYGTAPTYVKNMLAVPKAFNQSTQPTNTELTSGQMTIWTDTDDSKCYLVYNHGGTVKKVELI